MDFPTDKQDWRARALCGSLSPEESDALFFLGRGQKTKRAQLFCASCPVKQDCRDFSILYNESGVWGGMGEADRKAIAPLLQPMLRRDAIANGCLEERDTAVLIPQPRPLLPVAFGQFPTLAEAQ